MGHWWSEPIQVLAMIPKLGWFPTFHSTIADQGPVCASHWSRLWGHINEKTWLSLRSSEPKCGNKGEIGETRVELVPL